MPTPQTTAHINQSVNAYNYVSTAIIYCTHNQAESCTWTDVGLPNMALSIRQYATDLLTMYNFIINSGNGSHYNQVYLTQMRFFINDLNAAADFWQSTPSTWSIEMIIAFPSSYSYIINGLRTYINPYNEAGVVCPF